MHYGNKLHIVVVVVVVLIDQNKYQKIPNHHKVKPTVE